jgi:hypothetical protein
VPFLIHCRDDQAKALTRMTESDAEPARLRAWAYNDAVDAGFEPRSYAWHGVPLGTWVGRLDFKTWANTTAQGHMVCYFTAAPDGRRYRLSAFRSGASYRYTPKDGGIDFSEAGLDGRLFLLTVEGARQKGVAWTAAEHQSSEVDGRRPRPVAIPVDASSTERLFARELRDLREIGFAEGLPLSDAIDAIDAIDASAGGLRLECGSMGVAVEFRQRDDEHHLYRVVSLTPHHHAHPPYTSSHWRDIVTVLHSHMRPNDND